MKDISEYLKKFRRIISSGDEEREIISKEISGKVNIKIMPAEIDFHGGIVYLSVKPAVRSEIYINKAEIINELLRKGLNVSDLR